jgi:hypothetical protein
LLQTCKNPFPDIKYNYGWKTEIESIVKSVKPTNSHGYDEMFVKILKS